MWMRSATSKTCGMLWLMSTIGMPRARTSWMRSSTRRDSRTPRAAVGSSMMTRRLPKAAARATATPWRWPPERVSTGWLMFWMVSRPSSESFSRASRCMRARSRRRKTLPRMPGQRISRPRNRLSTIESAGERARFWWTVSIPAARASFGSRKWISAPSSRISPSSGWMAPVRALMRLVLPAPLSPMTARISPGIRSKSAWSRAVTRPKRLTRPLACRTGACRTGA